MNLFGSINSKNHNFTEETHNCLIECEDRYLIYICYLKQNEMVNKFTKEEEKKLYETLTIKEFIIIGNDEFHSKIKTIEKNIKANSLDYLNMEQLSKFLEEKRRKRGKILWTFFYILIIRLEEFHENFEKIYELSFKYGLTFLVFVYAENNKNIYYRHPINCIFQPIYVYSPEDIIKYLSQKFKIEHPSDKINNEKIQEILKIKIPKITFEQKEEDEYQGGCFELAETFDVNIIKKSLAFRFFN